MEKYRATHNEIDEEQPPKTKDERNVENNVNTLRNAADVAIASGEAHAVAIGQAVKGADKLTGGKSTEFLGKTVNQLGKSKLSGMHTIQKASNFLAESGLGDKIGKVASIVGSKNGGGNPTDVAKNVGVGKGNAGINASIPGNNNSSKSSNVGTDSGSKSISEKGLNLGNTSSLMGGMSFAKIKIIAACIPFFLILFLIIGIVGQKDYQNLAVTNLTVISESTAGGVNCTNEEIEEMILYVGGKTVGDIANSVSTNNVNYISNTNGYDYFKNSVIPLIEEKITSFDNVVVVLSFDVYDLAYFDSYLSDYRDLVNDHSSINFYVMSLNPVDDVLASSVVTNDFIIDYNNRIKSEFTNIYLDTNSFVGTSFITGDGISYDQSTNQNIHNYIINKISDSGSIVCTGGSIETIVDSQYRGGRAQVLSGGNTILSFMGQEAVDKWNSDIKYDVRNAGIGNGLAPAIAVYGLIQGALNNNFVIPYYWGGGHDKLDGVDSSWGNLETITVTGNQLQTIGSTFPKGIDSLGLITWALNNGGCSSYTYRSGEELKKLGTQIEQIEATPGDIIVKDDNNAMMVLRNDGSKVIVAESNINYGVIFNEYYYSILGDYYIMRMTNYYDNNCNG